MSSPEVNSGQAQNSLKFSAYSLPAACKIRLLEHCAARRGKQVSRSDLIRSMGIGERAIPVVVEMLEMNPDGYDLRVGKGSILRPDDEDLAQLVREDFRFRDTEVPEKRSDEVVRDILGKRNPRIVSPGGDVPLRETDYQIRHCWMLRRVMYSPHGLKMVDGFDRRDIPELLTFFRDCWDELLKDRPKPSTPEIKSKHERREPIREMELVTKRGTELLFREFVLYFTENGNYFPAGELQYGGQSVFDTFFHLA